MNRLAQCVNGFADWRARARELLAAGIPPDAVTWTDADAPDDLLASIGEPPARYDARPARVPRELPERLSLAARYRGEGRWALLYRVLWRVAQGERQAMLAGDPDGSELQRRIKTVTREAHHMHAFLRFRQQAGTPEFVAWHASAHDVLDLGAEHFARRMGRHSWLIVTPEGAAFGENGQVRYQRPLDPALRAYAEGREDACDELWKAYYASTFNPARLNEKVMRGHMPARFWRDLPEAPLIAELTHQARAGGRRLAQAGEVARREGHAVLIAQEKAAPQRPATQRLDACRDCEIWRQATAAVPGEGPLDARIMLVGEQPGDHEDLAGRPFVGPAGQLLGRTLAEAGLAREALYLTNAVKHFKWQPRGGPQGRGALRKHATPKPAEVRACHPWLIEELARVKPRVVVALGRTALASLLGVHDAARVRLADFAGQAFAQGEHLLIGAPHPAAILRDAQGGVALRAELLAALSLARELAEEAPR